MRSLSLLLAATANADVAQKLEAALNGAKATFETDVLQYQSPTNQWLPSTIYKFEDFRTAVTQMYTEGIGDLKLYIGQDEDDEDKAVKYGLVNIAAFIAQSQKETIQYDACTENSWDRGGWSNGRDPATNACGQLGQDYNSYTCPAVDDFMECNVDADVGKASIRGTTNAKWYGAPAPMECFPSPKKDAGYWDNSYECNAAWKDPPETCDDYDDQKAGAWIRNVSAENFGGETDLTGCCYWGRGVIQTTGKCNFGKLNYYLGAGGNRAKVPRNKVRKNNRFKNIDFCKDPESICSDPAISEMKWIAGFFYWSESVQTYENGTAYNYMAALKKFVDEGMPNPGADVGFINSVSGIVNRGCWNPPCPPNGELDGGAARAKNFQSVLEAFGLLSKRTKTPHDQFVHMQGDRQATKQEQEGKYAFVAKLSYADPASNATAYMKSSERDVAEQYCSGALVADNTVVTTASCCDFRKKSGVRVTVNGLTSTVKEMVWVDRYGFNPRSERYNLCKLTLEKKVPAATAKPIRLDSSGMEPLPDKTMLTMAGYGEKGEMQVLMVPKVDELECNALGAYNNRISTVEFCVGPSPNKSPEDDFACQGDMGSPIVHEANGELILTGLASSGNGCRTPKSFAIATKISTLVGWIGLPEHAAKEGDESAKYGSKSA
jgi:hypothetical protein